MSAVTSRRVGGLPDAGIRAATRSASSMLQVAAGELLAARLVLLRLTRAGLRGGSG